MDSIGMHRPRNLGWARAAALLYGDWGTSKAYVIGLAFVAAGFSAFPIILAVCGLTGLVAYNYIMLGSSHRTKLSRLLKGNVITEVAKDLPENIQLVIHS
jgi:hypothetical protein